jgi:hypothetical protein
LFDYPKYKNQNTDFNYTPLISNGFLEIEVKIQHTSTLPLIIFHEKKQIFSIQKYLLVGIPNEYFLMNICHLTH